MSDEELEQEKKRLIARLKEEQDEGMKRKKRGSAWKVREKKRSPVPFTADFLKRQEERRALERGWQVNIRFLSGDQYCGVLQSGEVGSEEAIYDWQQQGRLQPYRAHRRRPPCPPFQGAPRPLRARLFGQPRRHEDGAACAPTS